VHVVSPLLLTTTGGTVLNPFNLFVWPLGIISTLENRPFSKNVQVLRTVLTFRGDFPTRFVAFVCLIPVCLIFEDDWVFFYFGRYTLV